MAKERQCLKGHESHAIVVRRITFRGSHIRRMMPATTKASSLLISAALLAALIAPPASAQPAAPATAPAEAGTWTPERTAFGRVTPSRDVTLATPFAATVTQLAVEPGQQVGDGQVLARLEAPPLAVLVGKLQAARRAADLTEQRLAGLRQREKASLATKDDALQGEIAANEAQTALDEAWQALAEAL